MTISDDNKDVYIKYYCDLDIYPTDLNIYRGHLLNMTNLPTKYNDCHS